MALCCSSLRLEIKFIVLSGLVIYKIKASHTDPTSIVSIALRRRLWILFYNDKTHASFHKAKLLFDAGSFLMIVFENGLSRKRVIVFKDQLNDLDFHVLRLKLSV